VKGLHVSRDDDDDDRPRTRKSRSVWPAVLLVGALVGGASLIACCGGLAWFGLHITTTEVETALRDNPKLREHVGEIQKFSLNMVRSAAEDKDDVWVYDVVGSKASGELTVHHVTNEENKEVVHSARLRLKDGTTVELFDANGP